MTRLKTPVACISSDSVDKREWMGKKGRQTAMAARETEPLEAKQWDIRTGRLSRFEFPWPASMSHGDRAEALDAWGFQFEFTATPKSHAGPTATVYNRFLPDDDKIIPFHYCIVVDLNTYDELVLAADLPELVDALRFLAPLIKSKTRQRMSIRWTPTAAAAAEDAQTDNSAEVIDTAIQRAEVLAMQAESDVVDTQLWRQALMSAQLLEAEGEQDMRP